MQFWYIEEASCPSSCDHALTGVRCIRARQLHPETRLGRMKVITAKVQKDAASVIKPMDTKETPARADTQHRSYEDLELAAADC